MGVKEHGFVHNIRSVSMTDILAVYPFCDMVKVEHLSFVGAEPRGVEDAPSIVPSAPPLEDTVVSGLGDSIMHSTTEAH